MNTIKTLLFAVAMMVSTSVFSQNIISATEVKITINGQTTREQLAQIRTDLLGQGLEFRYQPNFDSERHLIGISYTVVRNSDAVTLGETSVMQLQNPTMKSTFHLVKTGEVFTSQCFGACNE